MSQNDTDGAFNVPSTGSLDADWGPSNNDVRQRVFAGVNSQALRNLNVNLNLSVASAPSHLIRTGRDDNGDLIFNDRPLGVGRNTLRADGQWTLNGNFSYQISFGQRKIALPPGIMINGGGASGGFQVQTTPQQNARRATGWRSSSTRPEPDANHANLHQLQRHADVAVFRHADGGARHAED